MGRYRAFSSWMEDCPIEWDYDDTYEILVDMETLEVVCRLTEPEDRTFVRDISALVDLLNETEEEYHLLRHTSEREIKDMKVLAASYEMRDALISVQKYIEGAAWRDIDISKIIEKATGKTWEEIREVEG